jgi:hypothetical protein
VGRASKSIDRSAADALLYGISTALSYMGDGSKVFTNEMGNSMVDYLIKIGEIKYPDKPERFRTSLQRLLTKNGFSGKVPLRFEGSPPRPSTSNFIDYLKGHPQRPAKSGSAGGIEWVVYEMMLYGMTKGLDSLGAQGQILVNRIAIEMLNYLVDTGKIERSDDEGTFIQHEIDFFIKAGFAAKIEGMGKLHGPRFDTLVISYTRSRYHMNVLKRLRDEGSVLYSCPPCIAAVSIRRSAGWKVQFDVDAIASKDGEVVLRHRIFPPRETFTEDMAEETRRLMR